MGSVKPATEEFVDNWWASLFEVTRADLWHGVTAHQHRVLGNYAGWFVAWRGDGVHVSVPAGPHNELVDGLTTESPDELQDPAYWQDFADRQGLRVIGPGTHHYLDRDPGPSPAAVEIPVAETRRLRSAVTEEEWQEAGLDDDVLVAFGAYVDGDLVAVSTLADFADAPRHLGVLVAPAARGQRLVDEVGRSAASYAVRNHGVARWRARPDNHGSSGAARRLGFEPWCTQLAIR